MPHCVHIRLLWTLGCERVLLVVLRFSCTLDLVCFRNDPESCTNYYYCHFNVSGRLEVCPHDITPVPWRLAEERGETSAKAAAIGLIWFHFGVLSG